MEELHSAEIAVAGVVVPGALVSVYAHGLVHPDDARLPVGVDAVVLRVVKQTDDEGER
jgi:hypothetical protein